MSSSSVITIRRLAGAALVLRLSGALAGYAMCRLDTVPAGGVNLGQNICTSNGGGYCPP